MDQWLAKFPKSLIAFVALTGGLLLIIIINPPHTVCDAQIEIFKNEVRNFLVPDPKSSAEVKITKFQRLKEHCTQINGPGGCYEFFSQVRDLLSSLDRVPRKCHSEVGGLAPVRESLWGTAELLVRLAWGGKPPHGAANKLGWLDYADINTFCDLQSKLISLYGKRRWQEFQEQMLNELPGVEKIPRERAWSLMLLSVNCQSYL